VTYGESVGSSWRTSLLTSGAATPEASLQCLLKQHGRAASNSLKAERQGACSYMDAIIFIYRQLLHLPELELELDQPLHHTTKWIDDRLPLLMPLAT
jgi:hypothetical protein